MAEQLTDHQIQSRLLMAAIKSRWRTVAELRRRAKLSISEEKLTRNLEMMVRIRMLERDHMSPVLIRNGWRLSAAGLEAKRALQIEIRSEELRRRHLRQAEEVACG